MPGARGTRCARPCGLPPDERASRQTGGGNRRGASHPLPIRRRMPRRRRAAASRRSCQRRAPGARRSRCAAASPGRPRRARQVDGTGERVCRPRVARRRDEPQRDEGAPPARARHAFRPLGGGECGNIGRPAGSRPLRQPAKAAPATRRDTQEFEPLHEKGFGNIRLHADSHERSIPDKLSHTG